MGSGPYLPEERLFGNLKMLKEEIAEFVADTDTKERLLRRLESALSWEPLITSIPTPEGA